MSTIYNEKAPLYHRYRPPYPPELIEDLIKQLHLDNTMQIADVGAGTGIFTNALLSKGLNVVAVEPNEKMRGEATRNNIAHVGKYRLVNGTAENTTLDANSFDLVTAVQAFHWFDKPKARHEFARILRKNGQVALIWNYRDKNSPANAAYNAVFEEKEGEFLSLEGLEAQISDFFSDNIFSKKIYPFRIEMTWDEYISKARTHAYFNPKSNKDEDRIVAKIREVFDEYQVGNRITVQFCSVAFVGLV